MPQIGRYDFKEEEIKVLKFWEEKKIYQKAKERNKGKKRFYFLQGPPYTSGKLHIGHAWNHALKDAALRYKRMKNLDVWDRGGYDMHGLPVAAKVQAMLNLQTKEDIEKYGVDKFIKECSTFASECALAANKDLWRFGIWMDHENAYWPIRNSYIEGEWWLIKKAHEHNRLYKAEKVMTWCGHCETALAKHELEYKNTLDDSIFLKFNITGKLDKKLNHTKAKKENKYLVIWTTTPWTIPFNLAVMVNPELDYVEARVENEIWIVAKALIGALISGVVNKEFKIIKEYKGEELLGTTYQHPLEKDIKQYAELKKEAPRVHSVILTKEYCDASAGSGLVHTAPGCGPEDFEVGKQYDIPPFNTLDEYGKLQHVGKFSGWKAKKDDKKFIDEFKQNGCLVASTKVEHEYPHCWRCKEGVVFRTTWQWFMKVEDLKEKIIEANQNVQWVPERGKKSFDDWVSNLRDNSITRQRFWGAPVPIWECEKCEHIEVIGSAEELRQKSINNTTIDDLHRPWVDEVKIRCTCNEEMSRIPDVLDVWIDAGTASWNCLDWPKNKDLLPQYFPADLILEATEQVRLWFSMLMIASFVSMDKPAFKNVYMHGMILDYQGTKMSKSLGNIISPYEIIEKYGVDVLRIYMSAVNAGQNINFSWEDVKIKARYLTILWNIHKFVIEHCALNNINPVTLPHKSYDLLKVEEAYMLSKLNSTIKKVDSLFQEYKLDETIKNMEDLFLELSRTYIQFVREKATLGDKEEKELVAKTMFITLFDSIKMLSVICPFITEAIYQNLRDAFKLEKESLHLYEWPYVYNNFIDESLEEHVATTGNIISAILHAREKAGYGVRWPLPEAVVVTKDEHIKKSITRLREVIKKQTNVKDIIVLESFDTLTVNVSIDEKAINAEYKEKGKDVISHITAKGLEHIYQKVKEENQVKLSLSDKTIVTITTDHFTIEKEVPEEFILSEIRNADILLATTMTKEMAAEGYARELMRYVQQQRKKAKMKKEDRISLHIQTTNTDIQKWQEQIAEKVGATEISIHEKEPEKTFTHKQEKNIKKETFKVFFEKS